MAATHVTFRVYLQVGVVWLYQGEKLRNKTLACTMFMPLQRAFLAALMALIPVKESFCTTCSGRYVAHFTAKIMFAVSYLPTGISLSAVQNMIHFVYFNSCHFHQRAYYELAWLQSGTKVVDTLV